MRLNWLGRAALNSPLRALAQAYVASQMQALGGVVEGGHVLEIGCGGGVGVSIILEEFRAGKVEAIDIDPKMIQHARQRLATYSAGRVTLAVGNATALAAKEATFDAVFDFGAIHLEPAWRKAVGEVARVLKPGARFFFELVTSRALRLSYPLLTEGFADMEPPSPESFLGELDHLGIVVGERFVRPRLAPLTGWVGDLIGVGWRS
ncbi:MAG TPA: methyltransferase domain-containing protein [Anaerolineales bacterium]|nr:methyltransferase domain-containing protein [Anaerolineales bacterium]